MTDGTPRRVVIVGASAAGLTAAETLRADGYEGELVLLGSEERAAYDRPPLSKQVLAGTWDPKRVDLLPGARYDELGITTRFGLTATALDVDARELTAGTSTIGYDAVLIATGVRPRTWPGTEHLRGVHVLRTLDDALAFKSAASRGGRVVVIGGGFLGSEAAATLRGLDVPVTLVERGPAPLARHLGSEVAALVRQQHVERGVDVRTNSRVEEIVHDAGIVSGVRLAGGAGSAREVLPTTCVLVAIGTRPATGWLDGSGLDLTDGLGCDATCRAAPGVYGAGDVARWYHRSAGATMRVEHRTNATEQAMAAARSILGAGTAYEPVPYFWSDQYDAKIQAYGVLEGADTFAVVGGSVAERRFVALYGSRGRVSGALAWRSPRDLLRARALVADRAPWPDAVPA